MSRRRIDIAKPKFGDEELQALRGPLESGWLTQGPEVSAFEQDFAKRHDVGHALATTSCTTALHLALAALDVGPGDEVIVPAFTWVATANVILYCGATPVFVDVDRHTFNLDVSQIAQKITKRTKAVIPVHLFGLCADMDGLRAVLPDTVAVVEDAACAAGASYKGTPAGGFGDFAAFSFHPRKSITTGEGGMLTTTDDDLAAKAEVLRNHGASISEEQRHHGPQPYILPDFNLLGFNYRMSDLQGAVGRVQLGRLDGFIAERERWSGFYDEAFADVPWIRPPARPKAGQHAWQAYVTYVDPAQAPKPRNEIMKILHENGIATRPGTHAVHTLRYYRDKYGFSPDDFPAARDCEQNSMALPLHNHMTQEDYEFVVSAIRSF